MLVRYAVPARYPGPAYRYSGNARYVAIACAGSLTAIALHSLVDFKLYLPSNAMLVVWIAAISEGLKFFTVNSGRSDGRGRSRPVTEGREV